MEEEKVKEKKEKDRIDAFEAQQRKKADDDHKQVVQKEAELTAAKVKLDIERKEMESYL